MKLKIRGDFFRFSICQVLSSFWFDTGSIYLSIDLKYLSPFESIKFAFNYKKN
jgi:hypothetical protein